MVINRENIFDIIKKLCLEPDKDYGQNFLVDEKLASRIVGELEIQLDENILEIGPGLGSLTHFLTIQNASLTIIDIDERMTHFLKQVFSEGTHLNIITGDIRKHDVSTYDKIIGNLPYNITTETITYLLLNSLKLRRMVLMCQAEAYERFASSGSSYSPTSVLVNLLGESHKLLTVSPNSFYPSPKCRSIVFAIDIRPNADHELAKEVFKLCKKLFINRRKTILNNLTSLLEDKNLANKACLKLGIDPQKRPEQITPIEYVRMYQYLKDHKLI